FRRPILDSKSLKENAMRMKSLLLAFSALVAFTPANADQLLSGAVTSASGEKLGGVMVSAKPEGGTITTTVLTDEGGQYYFPGLPDGKYRVWAKTIAFETDKGEVDLTARRQQNFTLKPRADYFTQLSGSAALAALPEDTDHDKNIKRLVRNICTGCHTPSYILQHKFDEAGWSAIIGLMKNVNVYGSNMAPSDRPPSGILDYHQKELAAYLAKSRGPGQTAMHVTVPPRPSGEAARVVFREYDVPLDVDANLPANFVQNDGSDWSRGTPSV